MEELDYIKEYDYPSKESSQEPKIDRTYTIGSTKSEFKAGQLIEFRRESGFKSPEPIRIKLEDEAFFSKGSSYKPKKGYKRYYFNKQVHGLKFDSQPSSDGEVPEEQLLNQYH